ncbi:MAG: hypothetical protein VYC39_00325 [Myxococcota bacterium]|nr:hypothetical protein [Myxococcota bacterium]
MSFLSKNPSNPYLKPFLLGLALHTIAAVSLSFFPLTNILGFERAFISGIIGGPIAAWLSIHVVQQKARTTDASLIWLFFILTSLGLIFLFPTVAAGMLVEWFNSTCNPQEGIQMIILLAGSTTCLGIALGMACARIFSNKLMALVATALVYCLLLGQALARLYFEPQIFAYSMPFGYFPGSLYDEEVRLTKTLVSHRIITVLFACAIVFSLDAFAPLRRLRPRTAKKFTIRLFQSFILVSASFYGWTLGETEGFNLDRSSIEKILSLREHNERLDIRFDSSFTEEQTKDFLIESELHYQQLQKFFSIKLSKPIRVFVYRNVGQKRSLMGAYRTQIARPWQNEIHIHGTSIPHPVLRHELAHIFAADFADGLFKVPAKAGIFVNMGIVEGTAVAADWPTDRMTVHQWAKAMIEQKRAPNPADLLSPQGFWTQSAARAYTVAGSFLRFLIDTYGIEKFKALYRSNSFETAYEKPAKDLAKEWTDYIDKIPAAKQSKKRAEQRFSRPSILEKVCAHETAKMKSDARAQIAAGKMNEGIALFRKVAEYRPADSSVALSISRSMAKKGHLKSALDELKAVRNSQNYTAQGRLRVELAIADLEWKTSNSTVALQILSMADTRSLSAGFRRLVEAKKYAMQQEASIQAVLRDYLLQEYSQEEGLVRLADLTASHSSNGLLHYLYARRLAQIGMSNRALIEIRRALSLGLPHPDFIEEANKMLGRVLLAARQFDEAEFQFVKMAKTASRAIDRLEALQWSQRAKIRKELDM